MNKKGFTLVEVIVSIVLVSVIMVSLLATLVKLRDTYTVIHENSDVIVYTSSIARVINNDLMKNNGIRYANCEIEGKKCELILGNAEKRKLEIIEEGEGIDLGDGKENIKHERILTTLKYTNITKEEKLIYIRTLILDRYENSESGVITTKGYNFYDMNVPESNTYYGKEADSNVVDTISRVNIRIWDGKSEESTKYDIVLYSSGRYDDSELVGKSYRIAFDTNGATESGTLEIDEVFGVAYFNSEKSHSSSNIIRKIIKPVKMENGKPMAFLGYYYYTGPSDSIGSQVVDSKGMIVSSSRLFKNDVTLSGIEELSEEERRNRERVIAEWTECTNGYTVKEGECVPEEYTVEIDKNGGSGGIDSYKATYLAMVPNLSKLQLPTRDGYKFKGLYEGTTKYQDENGIGQLMYEYTYGITVKADWEANKFTVRYNSNNAQGTMTSKECTYDNDCYLDTNIFSKAGYHFIGWKKENKGEIVANESNVKNTVLSGTVTYYAQWEGNTYTASFEKNGATSIGKTSLSCKVTSGSSCTVVSPGITRSGFTIDGWNTSNSATSGTQVGNNITLSDNTTYYAITHKKITMTFNRNGNTVSDESKNCTIRNNNTTCSITSPTITAPSGFSVVGYSTAASTHTSSWNQNTAKNVSDNATYYAQSSKSGKTVTITFNKNGNTSQTTSGGSASTANTLTQSCDIATVYNGATQATTCSITSPTITAPANKEVVGYNTSSSATTSSWNQNTAKNVSENATYYAISKSTGYYLTLDAGNGTIGTATGFTKSGDNRTATKLLLTGSAYGELPTASREGAAEFLGWYNSAGTKVSASTTMGSSSVTLYAKYKCSKQIHSEGACDSGTCFSQLYYEGGSASDYFGYSHPVYTGGACICYWNCG